MIPLQVGWEKVASWGCMFVYGDKDCSYRKFQSHVEEIDGKR